MKAIYRKLFSNYEDRFRTSIESDYVRNVSSREFKEIIDTYKEATGHSLDNNPGCGACVLRAFKVIGRWYFSEIEKTNKPKRDGK